MPRRHTPRRMGHVELIDALVADLQHLRDEIRWKQSIAQGGTSTSVTGASPSGGSQSDPTARQASSGLARHLDNVLSAVHRDLTWLYQRKLPSMIGRLELDDDRGSRAGGMSAYRGDQRAPAGRPDLQQALDAQRRRLDRGQSHGRG